MYFINYTRQHFMCIKFVYANGAYLNFQLKRSKLFEDHCLSLWIWVSAHWRQWEQWPTLFLGGSRITADGDCSHDIFFNIYLFFHLFILVGG